MKQNFLKLKTDLQFLQRLSIVLFILLCLTAISKCNANKKLSKSNLSFDSIASTYNKDVKSLKDSIKYLNMKISDSKSFKSENVKDVMESYDKKLLIKDKEISFLRNALKAHK